MKGTSIIIPLLVLLLASRAVVDACNVVSVSTTGGIPSLLSGFTLSVKNTASIDIQLVEGNVWSFQAGSSVGAIPVISVSEDSTHRIVTISIAAAPSSQVSGSPATSSPTFFALLCGLILLIGGPKQFLLFLGVYYLCFASTAIASVADNCTSIIITYPASNVTVECDGCNLGTATTIAGSITGSVGSTGSTITGSSGTTGNTYTPPGNNTCTNHLQFLPSQYYTNAWFCTSNHLPFTLSLSADATTLSQQFNEILVLSGYDQASIYSPTSAASYDAYYASYHPPSRLYDNNPTQILIGLSDHLANVNLVDVKLRLPSIYFGMFLAYGMDHFGINPHFLLAQAAKESFATAVSPTFTKNFIVGCGNSDISTGGCSGKVFDCRQAYDVGDASISGVVHQGCPNPDNFGIALGPFQIELEGFAEITSVHPQRFWVETPSHNDSNTSPRSPLYLDSGTISTTASNIKALLANFTSHNSDSLAHSYLKHKH